MAMSILQMIFLAVSFLLALAASWAVFVPFFDGGATSSGAGDRRDLLMRRDNLLDALEDLEQDFRTSKVSELDYKEARSELTIKAGEVISELANESNHDIGKIS